MKNNLLLFIFLISKSILAQGILDSLAPNISNEDNIELPEIRVPVNKYSLKTYLKDSQKLQTINDSFTRLWTKYDTLPPQKVVYYPFKRDQNRELEKANFRPSIITFLYLLLLLLLAFKYSYFSAKSRQEYWATLRSITYRDWLNDQLTILNPFNLLSKFINGLSIVIFIAIINQRLALNWGNNATLETVLILLAMFLVQFSKYFLGYFLAVLFENIELIKNHFALNQLTGSFYSVFNILIISVLYFMHGQWSVNILITIILFLLILQVLHGLIAFSFSCIKNRSNKFLYVIFYLCTLEIIPILLLSRWIAISYL